MAYSSLTAILTIVPGLPQTTSSNQYSTTSAIVGKHITRSDALINGMLAKRYPVPISPTPPLLSKLSEDIAAYYTYRSSYTQDNHNKLEYFEELKEDAFSELKLIREGDVDLIDTAGGLIAERTADLENSIVDSTDADFAPYFDIDDPLDWKFDPDAISGVKDRRG